MHVARFFVPAKRFSDTYGGGFWAVVHVYSTVPVALKRENDLLYYLVDEMRHEGNVVRHVPAVFLGTAWGVLCTLLCWDGKEERVFVSFAPRKLSMAVPASSVQLCYARILAEPL